MKQIWKYLIVLNTALAVALSAVAGYGIYALSNINSRLAQAESSVSAQPASESADPAPQLIFDDELIKVSFIKWYEDDSINGITYFKLKIENKSDKELMVYLENTLVNNIVVDSLTGIPNIIAAGDSSTAPYLLNTGMKGITSVDAINEVSFKMVIVDNSTNEVIKTTEQWRIYKK